MVWTQRESEEESQSDSDSEWTIKIKHTDSKISPAHTHSLNMYSYMLSDFRKLVISLSHQQMADW